MLTDEQQRFLELSKKSELLKQELKEVGAEIETLLGSIGVGTHFQDPADNTVFEVIKPTGRFVSFPSFGYNRTKREGERSGTLSVKRASELGY